MRSRIGEILVKAGLISDDQRRAAIAEQARSGERLGVILARMQVATDEQIAAALASQLGFRFVDLTDEPPDPVAARLVDRATAARAACVALRLDGDVLVVAMAEPLSYSLVPTLERQTGYRIREVVATRSAILNAIESVYSAETTSASTSASTEREGFSRAGPADDRSVEDLLQAVIDRALDADATDIHIDPAGDRVVVRYRVDGALVEGMELPRGVHDELVARIKIMAGLDVAERLLPQSGRAHLTGSQAAVHLRVSTLRTVDGERVVLRALDRRSQLPNLDALGLTQFMLGELRHWLRRNRGMIAIVGPRASGRTTTLYAAAVALERDGTAVQTIEDPIEAKLAGVAQSQIDESIGLTFGRALRSALDQDADAVLVGDLRDSETATVAAHAAATDRLVLAAVAGDDAASGATAIAQLAGAPLAASSLVGIVAQRLVRRLCERCRAAHAAASETLRTIGMSAADAEPATYYKPAGCDQCNHTGYRGRVALFEVMPVTAPIRELIARSAPPPAIREAAVADGMVTLADDGMAKARSGLTTLEEVRRTIGVIGETRALCPTCGAGASADFTICPRCGERLGPACAHCGRALQPGWTFCPYCAGSVAAGAQPPRRGIIRLVRNQDPNDTV